MSESPKGGRLLALVVGLACLWPCLEGNVTMRFRAVAATSGLAVPSEWTKVLLCLAVCACTVIAVACVLRRPDLQGGRAAVVAVCASGIAGFAGHATFVCAPLLGSAVTPAVLAAVVCAGAFIALHVFAWGGVLAGMPVAQALLAVAASNALSYALQTFLNAMPGDGLLYALAVCPLVSTLCWLYAAGRKTASRTAAGPCRRGVADEGGPLRRLRAGMPWGFVAASVALIVFGEVFARLLFSRRDDWPRETLGISLAICTVACLVLVGVLWVRRGRNARTTLFFSFVLLLVVYMGALMVTVVIPQSPTLLAERVMVAAGTLFRVFLWMALTWAACAAAVPAVPAFAVYNLLVLSLPLSSLLSFALDAWGATAVGLLVQRPEVVAPIAGCALFAIAAAYVVATACALHRGAAGWAGGGAGSISEAVGRQAQVDVLVARAGLTRRETEVLGLILKGYSAKVAAEKLGLAESTVVTHTTHLYRKLGVGSKQELLGLIDACDADDGSSPRLAMCAGAHARP